MSKGVAQQTIARSAGSGWMGRDGTTTCRVEDHRSADALELHGADRRELDATVS